MSTPVVTLLLSFACFIFPPFGFVYLIQFQPQRAQRRVIAVLCSIAGMLFWTCFFFTSLGAEILLRATPQFYQHLLDERHAR